MGIDQRTPLSCAGAAIVLILAASLAYATDPPGTITTVAGGGLGDGGPATAAPLSVPRTVAVDASGDLFVVDTGHHRIRRVATDGTITTIAGTGVPGFSGDGGAAVSASLDTPSGVAVDAYGNVFVADWGNSRIRKVGTDGTITTVAGNGTAGFSGDGGFATSAALKGPFGVAVDRSGNLFVADTHNNRIRRVGDDGTISTVAGNGTAGFSGDGGPATSASLSTPVAVAFDGSGNMFIADLDNVRVRKVASDGTITTAAGIGTSGFSGDGGPATSASLGLPYGVAVDGSGRILIADYGNRRVRRIETDGTISTVAGNGTLGFSGDGGLATSAALNSPWGVAADESGNLFIGDFFNNRIRRVAADGVITTVAGNGTPSFSGDGGPAISASLSAPLGMAVDASGSLFIADLGNSRVRRVGLDGTITTIAGDGTPGFSGDGGPATAASVAYPQGLAIDSSGSLFIAVANRRVRRVGTDGTITTVAGNGTSGFSGDGGPATAASLGSPQGLAVDSSGNLFICDTDNGRVRRVGTDGTITTVAGNGISGFSGDGGLATLASLASPVAVAVDGSGNLYIADRGNSRIRRVGVDGMIATVAGNGDYGFYGDGGPATSAALYGPGGVAVDGSGGLLICDRFSNRVRKVGTDGVITTIAGNGTQGFSGDGGPATSAALYLPQGVAIDGLGNAFFSESSGRVRRVTLAVSVASIDAPATVVQECDDGAEGATVHFTFDVVAGTSDLLHVRDVTGDRTLLEVAGPADGTYGVGPVTFAHGSSSVLIELLQDGAAAASATVMIQIEDTVPPVISGAGPKTIELQGPLTTLVKSLLGVTVSDACDPAPTVIFAPAALSLGTTSVTATARDATGNTRTETFDVTVVDTTPPVFTVVPEDVERDCAEGGVLVSFDVLAEDLSGAVDVACEDEDSNPVDKAGTRFDVGEHTVTCTATDWSGNTATCSFHVTVVDDDAPVLTLPDDITVGTEPGECFAFVDFEVTETDECDPDAGISCEAPWGAVQSGDAFPVGTTTVTCTARDHAGNEATASFHVTVEDREPPLLSFAPEVTLVTDCAGTPLTVSPATLGVTAVDNCDPFPVLTCAPTLLQPGNTEVTCTARDHDGNESTCAVTVTVRKGPFECRILRPLDGNVDNLIKPGKPVVLKVRVTCDNVFDPAVTATIDEVVRIDGAGTPVGNEVVDDQGASSDNTNVMRLDSGGELYIYNLSTSGWPTASGARFRVTLRIVKEGHVDTLCSVVLKNK